MRLAAHSGLWIAALQLIPVVVAVGCSEAGAVEAASDAGSDADGAREAAPDACASRSFTPLVAADGATAVAVGAEDIVYVVAAGPPGAGVLSSVYRVPKKGGAGVKIAETVGLVTFVGVAGEYVTWARDVPPGSPDLYIEWRKLDGSDGGSSHVPSGWSFDFMTVGPEAAYVGVRSVPDTSPVNGIYAFRRDGTYAQIVQLPAAGDMFVDATNFWYLTERFNGMLRRRSLVDGQEQTVATGLIAPLVADGDHVFAHRGWPLSTIVGVSKTTGATEIELPLDGDANFRPIALLADEIVWSQDAPPSAANAAVMTGLFRVRRDGTCRIQVDPSMPFFPFVSGGDAVYFVGSGGVFAFR